MLRVAILAVLVGLVLSMTPAAMAQGVVMDFDPAAGEFPEGIAFDHRGRMYVSLAPLGEIRVFSNDGGQGRVFAQIDPGTRGLGILGLAFDRRGNLYAAAPSDTAHGVWQFDREGHAELVEGSDAIVFPNAITFDQRGAMYVSDSIGGAIWRVNPGEAAELWISHEELEGLAILNEFPLGANGIVYARGMLFVANTEKKQLVSVEIQRDGSPGEVRVVETFPGEADFLDGVTADVFGNLYVVVAGRNAVVMLARDGSQVEAANAEDALSIPASVAFGTRGPARKLLYITNLSLSGLAPVPQPSVVAVPTQPVPWGVPDGNGSPW